MQAYDYFSITRLAAIIFDLRADGHFIHKEDMRSERGGLYAKYYLNKGKQNGNNSTSSV